MDTTAIETRWKQAGYLDIDTRTAQPNISRQPHAHPFDARGLIVAGELTLTWEGQTRTFRVGETFDMPAGCLHSELYGPEGATLLIGRKHHAASA
jgi:quercetin dioxygenase-like cupin family protein